MKQHYSVGQYLRNRYINGQPYKLLSDLYDHREVSSVTDSAVAAVRHLVILSAFL